MRKEVVHALDAADRTSLTSTHQTSPMPKGKKKSLGKKAGVEAEASSPLATTGSDMMSALAPQAKAPSQPAVAPQDSSVMTAIFLPVHRRRNSRLPEDIEVRACP